MLAIAMNEQAKFNVGDEVIVVVFPYFSNPARYEKRGKVLSVRKLFGKWAYVVEYRDFRWKLTRMEHEITVTQEFIEGLLKPIAVTV